MLATEGIYQLIYERDDSWQGSPAYQMIDMSLKGEARRYLANKNEKDRADYKKQQSKEYARLKL